MSHHKYIPIPETTLQALVSMAESYLADIESGLEDGTYDAADNPSFPANMMALTQAQALLAGPPTELQTLIDLMRKQERKGRGKS